MSSATLWIVTQDFGLPSARASAVACAKSLVKISIDSMQLQVQASAGSVQGALVAQRYTEVQQPQGGRHLEPDGEGRLWSFAGFFALAATVGRPRESFVGLTVTGLVAAGGRFERLQRQQCQGMSSSNQARHRANFEGPKHVCEVGLADVD